MTGTKADLAAIRERAEAATSGQVWTRVSYLALLDHIDALESALRGVVLLTKSLHEYREQGGSGIPLHQDDCRFCAARRLVEES